MPPEVIPLRPGQGAVATSAAASLRVSIGQYSAAGSKAENQDFHGAIIPEGADLVTKGVACAIADGISTSNRGAEAAETAVKSFLTDYFCTSDGWSARRAGDSVIGATNSWMHSQNMRFRPREEGDSREKAGLICTLSALVVKSRSAHLFHVGDSQIARLSGKSLEVLTTPHRVELGGGQSYLGRALGVDRTIEVEYRQVEVAVGDIFLLTTDGVYDFLDQREIVDLIENAATIDGAARRLADAAMERGSDDNVTVQLLRIESLPRGEVDDLLGKELRLASPPSLKEGDELDGYRMIELLHSGSRSHVWRTRHPKDDHDTVLKVPSTEQRGDPSALAALMLEEWVLRRLSHPNLLAAAPQHQPRSATYSIADFVPGKSLHQLIAESGPLPLAQTRAIIRQVSAGLEAMHRRGMFHRDLRPHNIVVGNDGAVTIIDFGSVQVAGLDEVAPRQIEDAAYAGTFQFTAPEIYLGHGASVESDVFSLGVIAYQMLTGALPYGTRVSAANTSAAQRKLRYRPAVLGNPDLPGWIDAALARAVAVDPQRRYERPAELVQDLANPNHSLAIPQSGARKLSARFWRNAAIALAAALALSILTRPDVQALFQT